MKLKHSCLLLSQEYLNYRLNLYISFEALLVQGKPSSLCQENAIYSPVEVQKKAMKHGVGQMNVAAMLV